MNLRKVLSTALILTCLLTLGCSRGPVVDDSSPEARKASMQKVRDSLSEEEKAKFDNAMRTLASEVIARAFAGDESVKNFSKENFDGKTAAEIIERAEGSEARMEAFKASKKK
ncbi:MAG: hypothetical protein P1V97_34845 [Planctomycetota bacterium]|nr:hypothetical protein [Planctomycetota bacterium]